MDRLGQQQRHRVAGIGGQGALDGHAGQGALS